MAAVVSLFIFIVSSLSIIEAHLVTRTNQSARKDGRGVSARACIPGVFYRGANQCEQCFCNDRKIKVCNVCKENVKKPSRTELIHIFNPAPLSQLPEVHDAAAKCKPGKAYRMDCNRCICTSAKSLLCETLLCPSYDDVNKIRAKNMSGGSCVKGDTKKQECIKCLCINGRFSCTFKKNCVPEKLTVSLQYSSKPQCVPGKKYLNMYDPNRPPCICALNAKLHCPAASLLKQKKKYKYRPFDPAFLDPRSGKKCDPSVIYKKACNRCTCSRKRLLHCTLMTCVKSGSIRLHKRRPRLGRQIPQELTVRPPRPDVLDLSHASSEERSKNVATTRNLKRTRKLLRKVNKMPFDEEFLKGKKCEPGVMYRLECNRCRCSRDGSLLCTTMACPNVEEMLDLKKVRQKLEKENE